jgi:hypothetical protein
MENFSIFVDPEKLESVISELEDAGLTVIRISSGGPEALIYFEGDDESMKVFLENNSFDINEDSILNH